MNESTRIEGRTGRVYAVGREPLARGGQGAVWPAIRDDGMSVAIKVANPTDEARRALQAEAHLLHHLQAQRVEGVAECLDEAMWDGCPAFVMPRYPLHADRFVERVVANAPTRALPIVLRFGAQIARHLGALHRVEVALPGEPAGTLVHRDVKPENILVDGDGGVRLADLGGTLVVRRSEAVHHAVFGSPLWAPYDQVLPGVAEANPTWDTYALNVVLFWWLTGNRPAFQADPSPLLTEAGMEIWTQLCAVAQAQVKGDRQALVEAHQALEAARGQRRESELVDVRGHAAIQETDRQALRRGITSLADPALYGRHTVDAAVDRLTQLLSRGLSPLSHPSPPNRFWLAGELADALESVAKAMDHAREDKETRQGLLDRVRHLEQPLPTAIAIDAGASPEPLGARPPVRSPRRARARAKGPSIVWGLLAGIVLFLVFAAPLILALYRRI